LRLGAPEDERTEAARQQRKCLLVQSRSAAGPRKGRGGAEHARVQELEQAPQLAEVVFDGRSAQREAVPCPQQPRRLCRRARRVLDRLRFVENDVLERDLRQVRRVATHRAVRRQHQVVLDQLVPQRLAPGAGVLEHPQSGREPRRLLSPVEDQRPRSHHQRRGPRVAC
jgi:hypothetical protein